MSESLAFLSTDITKDDTEQAYSPNIEPPYKIFGGIYRAEAIMLLRRFYVQENEKGLCFVLLYILMYLEPFADETCDSS
jgi:hypothetical protein